MKNKAVRALKSTMLEKLSTYGKSYLITVTVIWKSCGMMSPIILIFSTICVHIKKPGMLTPSAAEEKFETEK